MEIKREKIIKACAKAISISGFKKASIQDISKEAGVAKGLVYYYFKDKDNLIFESYLYYVGKIDEYFKREMFDTKDLFDMVEMTIKVKARFFKDYPEAKKFLELSLNCENKLIKEYNKKSSSNSKSYLDKNLDLSKFKKNVDMDEVLEMMSLIGQSLISNINSNSNIDELVKKCHSYFSILKKALYKESVK